MTKRVKLEARSGFEMQAEVAEPAGDARAPGVVLVQEWWGVNDHVKDLTTRLAGEGFLVIAPDLYDGKTTKDPAEAGALMQALDTARAVDQIAGAVAWLKASPRCSGKVGVTGFCMGGAMSFAAACHVPGLSAVVPFYGVPVPEKVDYAKVTAPIQAHVAEHDAWVTVAKAKAIQDELASRSHPMELCVYDAQHAFVNDTRPEVYHPENAKLAWGRMVEFFRKHLA
ncbi:MAG: dienelactone hydrolase family protein [Myxococcales bacterium]|jgi:carboxymethylenebutenolidase|nr:dienelactone hydrolase family protein [Myxococcales bacterium]